MLRVLQPSAALRAGHPVLGLLAEVRGGLPAPQHDVRSRRAVHLRASDDRAMAESESDGT